MKLALIHKRKQYVVTDDVTQFNIGVSFIDLQKLEKLIVKTYEEAAQTKFPNKPLEYPPLPEKKKKPKFSAKNAKSGKP